MFPSSSLPDLGKVSDASKNLGRQVLLEPEAHFLGFYRLPTFPMLPVSAQI